MTSPPDVHVHVRALGLEADALRAMALTLLQYTPQVTQAEEATLLLEVSLTLRLFGDVRALGFAASLKCAPTAHSAGSVARECRACHAGRALLLRLERQLSPK